MQSTLTLEAFYEGLYIHGLCLLALQYKQQYRNTMTKLFADLELKKQRMEEAEANERKRQREEEDAIEIKAKKEKEWKQEWEASLVHFSG